MYECWNISSDPDCTFPRICITSLNFNNLLLKGGRNTSSIGDCNHIEFILFAVNGAGNGNATSVTCTDSQTPWTGLCNKGSWFHYALHILCNQKIRLILLLVIPSVDPIDYYNSTD